MRTASGGVGASPFPHDPFPVFKSIYLKEKIIIKLTKLNYICPDVHASNTHNNVKITEL